MKILIIDDNPRRYSKLAIKLDELGVAKSDYTIVDCIKSAEELVENNYYDLIVLDILIPYFNYGDADKKNSLDFFDYIHSNEFTRKPEKIIGITSDREVLEKAKSKFQEFTWQIIEYSDINLDWLNTLLAYIKYLICKNNLNNMNYFHDVLIVNALIKPELSAILDLPWDWTKIVISDNGILVNSGHIQIDDKVIKVAAIHATEMGMVSTAVLATQLIYLLEPKVVCMTGICAGYSDKVNLGDIIVASTSWDHQSGKRMLIDEKVVFKYSPQYIPINNIIKRDFQNLSQGNNFEDLNEEIRGKVYSPNLRIGPIASSSIVLADNTTLQTIVSSQNRDLLAIDMEVFGLYSACHYHFSNIYFFALKGVCDFADSEKNDDFQEYAAKNSAFALNLYLKKNLLKLL